MIKMFAIFLMAVVMLPSFAFSAGSILILGDKAAWEETVTGGSGNNATFQMVPTRSALAGRKPKVVTTEPVSGSGCSTYSIYFSDSGCSVFTVTGRSATAKQRFLVPSGALSDDDEIFDTTWDGSVLGIGNGAQTKIRVIFE